MGQIHFTITLTSDAEPASGFGTELVDALLPRNVHGRVVLPATHLKGLMRENLEKLPGEILPLEAVDKLFGKEGDRAALFHIDDAAAAENARIIDITRTRLNSYGIAEDGSLRTAEAVAAGTRFTGKIRTRPNLSPPYEEILKFGLLSIFSVGGGRNRGSGACYINFEGDSRTPGELIKSLATVDFGTTPSEIAIRETPVSVVDNPVLLKLVFKADNPVCVPEIPIVKNNMISSGFSIPASAVQGAILHRINAISEPLATACFKSNHFRAWPLNPAGRADSLSLRVSFTHKVSKLKIEDTDNYHFEDETIKAYDWDKVPSNSPLKASDGVLLVDGKSVKLWKSSDMARVITAHGVHNGDRMGTDGSNQKRNLFTVEAMAPELFTGIVSMPKSAADLFLKSLEDNSFMQLGKSRSVRGGGELSADIVDFSSLPLMKKYEPTVFIVQSPILVPHDFVHNPVEKIIARLVADAGFGTVLKSSGSITTQFGWNRTVKSRKNKNGFLGGQSVIVPGAVFKLNSPVENLEEKLIAGIGGGRENGFGAVLPHPGVAERLFPEAPEPKKMTKSAKNFALQGFKLWQQAKGSNLSASQVSRVRELAGLDGAKAIEYLERQKNERPKNILDQWATVMDEIKAGIEQDARHMENVLKVCQDLLVADKGEN